MNVNLSQLADELTAALSEFLELQQIILEANEQIGDHPPSRVDLIALGGILHDLYRGMENIWERIVKQIDPNMPNGKNWHRELLNSVSHPIPNRRPAVISQKTAEVSENYLGFRHLNRHSYGFNLSWIKLEPLWRDAPAMIEMFSKDIEQFINFLKMMSS